MSDLRFNKVIPNRERIHPHRRNARSLCSDRARKKPSLVRLGLALGLRAS